MADIRIGLAGTGYWAAELHAAAIDGTPGVTLASVWGRRSEAAAAVATRFGAEPFTDFDAFLDTVDAVEFAVPPDVQQPLAMRAAAAGKHLLLEKPIAVSLDAADELVAAVEAAGVTSIVFLTIMFDGRMRAIAAEAADAGWTSGDGLWLGSALEDDNPFNTPWRHEKGGLWDLGPHAVSVLWATLGPIVDATGVRGARDLVHATFTHRSGATSTAAMTLHASDAADGFSTLLWGPRGRQALPVDDVDSAAALGVALTELVDGIRSGGTEHDCDVRHGRDIVAVLARVEQAIGEREGTS